MRGRFRIFRKSKQSGTPGEYSAYPSLEPEVLASGDISTRISDNEKRLQEAFGYSSDLVIRKIKFGAYSDLEILVVHIDGLVDDQMVTQGILRPIGVFSDWPPLDEPSPVKIYSQLKSRLIAKDELSEVGRMEDLLKEICFGNSAIMVDGNNLALIADVKGWRQRNIESPTTEPTIRGAKEGFVETTRTNTSILRRHIRDPRLRIEERTIGAIGRTTISIVYIAGVAGDDVVQEVRDRVDRISIDSIQESGQLEEYIEDAPLSPFPTILRTERVDRVVGALLEGRIAILTEGTPFALIVPCNLFMFLSAPDDYFERSPIGSLLRMLRLFLFFIALLLPSFFVVAVTFHQEMIPTNLAVSIAAQREGVPFPALAEAIILDLAYEVLREGTVRVPLARNLASESPRQIFWVYDRVLLIGEKLAREEDSITQVLDFYNRDQEPRMGTHLMVVKGTTLDEIMSARFELERQPNRGFDEIGKVVAARKSTSWVPTALEFCRELETEGLEPVLGAAEVVHRPRHEPEQGVLREVTISHTARISGLGAFKGNQLVGWLNDRQSRGVLWVRGKVRSGIIVIKNPQAEERLISLEIRRTGRKITPQMIDGRPVIKIRIDVEGSFGETQEEIQFLGDSELWDSLERRFAAAVRNEVLAALQAAQEDLESDILGLGRAVHNAYPREWQVMKDNWDEIFPTLKVEVEVFATLKTSGLTLRRIRNR